MENQKPDNTGKNIHDGSSKSLNVKFAEKLPAAGWGLQFIWIGIVLLLKRKTSIILLGIGVIILLIQVVRKYLILRMQTAYIIIGLLFMLSGFLENWKPDLPLIPVFLIVVGTGLLLSFIKHIISK
ncbi:MAG: hypothetical protein JW837_01765 [Sedimentisphaerales bacterium]|nr:hypothetical protein [Sedimentisphaerales bacterium]